jgi:hypothetical protein
MANEQAQKPDPYGYNVVDDIEVGGRYLSFRKGDKGRIIQLRLASKPMYVIQHWVLGDDGRQTPILCKGEECAYCGKDVPPKERLDKIAKWGWVVIDREDGKPKVFTGPTLIARKIRKLVGDEDWGDPFLYDVKIERTEEPGGSYYNVTPVPKGKGEPITEAEKKVIEDGKFDLKMELEGSKESQHLGDYGAKEVMETAPEEGEEPTVEEGEASEVKPEDIPF